MTALSNRLRGRLLVLPVVLVAAFLCALPAAASAMKYTVNSVGDQPDLPAAGCETSSANCTLRAAIEASNGTVEDDEIVFSPLFNGDGSSKITWGITQPAITDSVKIEGGRCETEVEDEAGEAVEGPCVGLDGGGANFGIDVAGADDVTVEGLAIDDAAIGINAGTGSKRLTVKNTWVGVALSGALGPINHGIRLGAEADEAVVGGPAPSERNVIAATQSEGLGIKGASDAAVQGNWFGLAPDGLASQAAAVEIGIEITGSGAAEAVDNEIGADVGAAGAATAACDGGCNVIANTADISRNAIDLRGELGPGEAPPTGTTIHGNFIGLGPEGSAQTGFFSGVEAARSTDTLVGGPDPGDANHLTGGQYGVRGENSPGLVVEGNAIGMNAAETQVTLDPLDGIAVTTEGSVAAEDRALVAGNRIASGLAGRGVEIQGAGAEVIDNTIGLGTGGVGLGAGEIGIKVYEGPGESRIEGNTIVGAAKYGVLVESPAEVESNTILSSGEVGVLVEEEAPGQPLVGVSVGGEDALENEISGSDGPAIKVVGSKVRQVYAFRNHGSGNSGLFIDLGGDGPGVPSGPGHPNDGLQAPTIESVTATAAGGSAEPEAIVNVFRKASAAPGEVESFLATTVADASGKWSVAFTALPAETNIAALQGTIIGTSELALAATPALQACLASSSSECGGLQPPPPGPSPKPTPAPPETKITKAPKAKSTSTTAKFKFTSSLAGSSFECKLDKGKFKACRSPKTYKKLKSGKHVFKVRAKSSAGVVDPSPATKKFMVTG